MTQEAIRPAETHEKLLAGKVALITGSSRDIGAEIAKALAAEGVNIIGNYREKQKRATDTQAILSSLGVRSEMVQADITSESDRNKLGQVLQDSFGGTLDFLVLNASGPSRDINVDAANSLLDIFLPKMSKGGKIILMQSVPGHFEPQLSQGDKIPEFYKPIAKAKYEGEQSLRARMTDFRKREVSFFVVCPPEVIDTSNVKVFQRQDLFISEKHAELSAMLGIPSTVTKGEVAQKTAELLRKKDLPMGHVELFGETQDARSVLSAWYGDNAIFVDTLKIEKDKQSGTGRLIVTKEHTRGHFNDNLGLSFSPGHLMIESAAQTLGLIAMENRIPDDVMPLFQGIGSVQFLKSATIGDVLQVRASLTEQTKRGFVGNAIITNQDNEETANINDVIFVIVNKAIVKRMLGTK